LFHLGGPRRLSRFELGLLIASRHGFDAHHLLAARAEAEAGGPTRPRDVSLDSDKIRALLTTRLRAPEEVY
jgi:dTDP-4-dehydrorhamnose reductase